MGPGSGSWLSYVHCYFFGPSVLRGRDSCETAVRDWLRVWNWVASCPGTSLTPSPVQAWVPAPVMGCWAVEIQRLQGAFGG